MSDHLDQQALLSTIAWQAAQLRIRDERIAQFPAEMAAAIEAERKKREELRWRAQHGDGIVLHLIRKGEMDGSTGEPVPGHELVALDMGMPSDEPLPWGMRRLPPGSVCWTEPPTRAEMAKLLVTLAQRIDPEVQPSGRVNVEWSNT